MPAHPSVITALTAAVEASPDDLPLRLHLAFCCWRRSSRRARWCDQRHGGPSAYLTAAPAIDIDNFSSDAAASGRRGPGEATMFPGNVMIAEILVACLIGMTLASMAFLRLVRP
jgi:hypothetical protein